VNQILDLSSDRQTTSWPSLKCSDVQRRAFLLNPVTLAQGRTVAPGARAFGCAPWFLGMGARGGATPLPRLSAAPSCILESLRWHRGSTLKSPGAGLARPLPPGSLPVGLRPGSLPGSMPRLRPNCQASLSGGALRAVKNRGPARAAPAPYGLDLSRPAPVFSSNSQL